MRVKAFLAAGVVLLLTAGCQRDRVLAPETRDEPAAGAAEHPGEELSRLELGGGGRAVFRLLGDGALMLVAEAPSSDEGTLKGIDFASMNPIEIFELLAGTDRAPDKLRETVRELERARRIGAGPGDDGSEEDPGKPQKRGSLDIQSTAAGFIGSHCVSVSGGFSYCLTNLSVGKVFNEHCSQMTFVVNPTRGDVIQTIKYKKGGSYHTIDSSTVLEGYTRSVTVWYYSSWSPYLPKKDTRAIVTGVSGSDEYHVAVYGF